MRCLSAVAELLVCLCSPLLLSTTTATNFSVGSGYISLSQGTFFQSNVSPDVFNTESAMMFFDRMCQESLFMLIYMHTITDNISY